MGLLLCLPVLHILSILFHFNRNKALDDALLIAVRKSHCDAGGVWKQEFFNAQFFVHKNEHEAPDTI